MHKANFRNQVIRKWYNITMITFWEDEYEVEGKPHWIEIQSEWGDLVLFLIAGEQVGERFSSEDPIATFALDGERLRDPEIFVKEGIKADWMGKPDGPYPLMTFDGPETVMQCLDFEQDEDSVTIILKRYNVNEEVQGHSFSYTMPKADFKTLASDIAYMTAYSA